MKKRLFAILLTFMTIQLQAIEKEAKRVPIIRSATSETNAYQAAINLNPDYISFSDYHLEKIKQGAFNDDLRLKYVQAQKFYFQKDYFQALKKYQEITGLRNKRHWNAFSRKLILLSLVKAHELSYEKNTKVTYLKLMKDTFPNFQIEDLQISPTAHQKINKIKNTTYNWPVPEHFESFNYIIINGHIESLFPGKIIKVPHHNFLVTLLSDSYFPIETSLNYTELKQWRPNAEWINTGTCQFPNFKSKNLDNIKPIFYNENCILNAKKENLIKNQKNVSDLDLLKSKGIELSASSPDLQPALNPTETKQRTPGRTRWLKNKWLWIGVAAVAGAVIVSNQNSKDSPAASPKVKQGF